MNDRASLDGLEVRLRAILPEEYQDAYESVQPISMGSAGLKYGIDGKVAWDEIWETFCDLAMAGGPPHKGTLLEPATAAEIAASGDRYEQVVTELRRGITMVTGLTTQPADAGWIRVPCRRDGMADWLTRAIVMENVSVRRGELSLELPASPHYRLDKEIKNVVTVIAKTCHYWTGHVPRAQQRAIARLFAEMEAESPLIEPAVSNQTGRETLKTLHASVATDIQRATGLRAANATYAGWLGIECPHVHAAVWMMRALVASNVLARREQTVLFVPVNAQSDPDGHRVTNATAQVYGFAVQRGVL